MSSLLGFPEFAEVTLPAQGLDASAFVIDDIAGYPSAAQGVGTELDAAAAEQAWGDAGMRHLALPLSVLWRWPAEAPACQAGELLTQEWQRYAQALPKRAITRLALQIPADPALMSALLPRWASSLAPDARAHRALHVTVAPGATPHPTLPPGLDELHLTAPADVAAEAYHATLLRWAGAWAEDSAMLALDYVIAPDGCADMAFNRSLKSLLTVAPARIRLRLIEPALHHAAALRDLVQVVLNRLADAGYGHLAAGLFVRADDRLLRAQCLGRLFLSPVGIWEGAEVDYITLGAGGGALIGGVQCHNEPDPERYAAAVQAGRRPYIRARKLALDTLLRRVVAHQLLAQGYLDLESVEFAYFIKFEEHFAPEMRRLAALEREGWLVWDEGALQLTPPGRLMAATVARVFLKGT